MLPVGRPIHPRPHGDGIDGLAMNREAFRELEYLTSPERLADTTIREQWERAQKINIRGEPVDTTIDGPLADGEWMKQNLARAKMVLPDGYCGLPLQKSCTHSNTCLTCPLFITTAEFLPQYRKQLDDTRALIVRAEADGHTRMVEMNRAVETNLLTIIAALGADQRDCQCTAAGNGTCCLKEPSDASGQ